MTYGMTSSSTYYFTKAMTDLFVNSGGDAGVAFQSIGTMADFWSVSLPLCVRTLDLKGGLTFCMWTVRPGSTAGWSLLDQVVQPAVAQQRKPVLHLL